MKYYITGADDRATLLDAADLIRQHGHSVVTPHDIVDEQMSEGDNLIARLQAVLECEGVVTTSPLHGTWGHGADKEVALARIAQLPVLPAANFIKHNS